MTERLANGQFGEKPKRRGNPNWVKGHPKMGGRQKGTPNKITREVREWLALLVSKAEVQDAVEERIKNGDAVAFFRALDQAIGRPTERTELTIKGPVMFGWIGQRPPK